MPDEAEKSVRKTTRRKACLGCLGALAVLLAALLVFLFTVVVPVAHTWHVLGDVEPDLRLPMLAGSGGEDIAKEAVRRLGGPARARARLRQYLGMPASLGFRAAAVWALGACGRESVPDLIGPLDDEDRFVRRQTEDVLVRVVRAANCDDAVVSRLLAAASDERDRVRYGVLGVLERAVPGDKRVIAMLIDSLGDRYPPVRQRAAFALGKGNVVGAIPHLAEAATDPDERCRRYAAMALGWIGGCTTVNGEFCDDDRDMVLIINSVKYAEGSAPEPSRQAAKALLGFLDDRSEPVRSQALSSLGHVGPGAVAIALPLSKLLGDADVRVRRAAADALAEAGSRDAAVVAALRAGLKSEDATVRSCCVRALGRAGPAAKAAAADLQSLLDSSRGATQVEIAEALGRIGEPREDVTAALLKGARRGGAVGNSCLEAMGSMGDKARSSIPRLREIEKTGGAMGDAARRAIEKIEKSGK